MFTKFTGLRRVAAAFVVAATALLGGCATYPESYYYGDSRYGGDYYYDEPYRAVDYCCDDYYSSPYWGGGWYYSALWPVYSRWYDPWYYPGYYYGVTYFPRSWYGFSYSFFDYDPWWRHHHYSPYRYSWYDNYYAWHQHRPNSIGRHNYNHYSTHRFGSARAEAERLAARSRGFQQQTFGVGSLQTPNDDSWRRVAERTRVREAGGRGRDNFGDNASAPQYGRTAATTAGPARESAYRYDGRPTGDARRPTAEAAYGARDANGQVSRYGGTRQRDAQAPITRDDARMSSRPMERTPRAWSAGPRDDTPIDRSAYRTRGVPEPTYRERGAYRGGEPAYSEQQQQRRFDSDRRVYSRDRDSGYAAPQREYGRYQAPQRHEMPQRHEAPQREYGRYEAPQRDYGRAARDSGGYAAPRGGGYSAPSASYAPRGESSRGSTGGGGWSGPSSGGGGYSAPAPSPSRSSDSGSRGSSDRGSVRGRDEE